ncbi:hypothetical protein EDC96DRAFT_515145 [Choanephora cucurbitarum]|nr:hypothetical protein EDC96DRAFT_515145 [Choanephora cucurbitarum]
MIVNVNRKAKTEPRYIGPFTIKGWARSGAYILEDLTGALLSRDIPTHQINMIQAGDQRSQSDLAEKHYEVQAIVNHRGTGKDIKYYVHWRGYDDQAKYNTCPINEYWARRNVANAVTRGTALPATVNKRKDSSTKRSNRRSARNNTRL